MVTRLTVTTFLLWLRAGSGLKVTEITAQAGSLSTSRHTELTCDFLKWKQEEFFSLTWAVELLGIKTDFLQYNKDGSESGSSVAIPQQEKYSWTCNLYIFVCSLDTRTPSNGIVGIDLTSVEDRRVSVQVSEAFDEEELRVCCEVRVLEDRGYGQVRPKRKEKCADFSVDRGETNTRTR